MKRASYVRAQHYLTRFLDGLKYIKHGKRGTGFLLKDDGKCPVCKRLVVPR